MLLNSYRLLRFWCRMTLGASTGALSILQWFANWSNVTTTSPVPAFVSTGVFTITLPTQVNDEYDASLGANANIPVNLSAAHGSLEGNVFGFVSAAASGNVITIHTGNVMGFADNIDGYNLFCVAF